MAHCGIDTYGFDRNAFTIQTLVKKEVPFYEPTMAHYLSKYSEKTFFLLSTWLEIQETLPQIDAIFFTVGTKAPTEEDIQREHALDLTDYFSLFDQLFSHKKWLKKGIKLIIRTTLPLGGTDQLKNYLEEKLLLKEGDDFFLAFVPERIVEGVAMEELRTTPKIVGVYSDEAFKPVHDLFQKMGGKVIRVSNPVTAEFCKLTDNSFRSTLFSYSNEIAMFANRMDINVDEVINTVNDHYQRNHIPKPGFVSGYCLSKDPYIFELDFLKKSSPRDFHSIWYYGRKTNDYLVSFVVNKVIKNLKNKKDPCIAILGLSFKEDVDDFRMSHSFKIIDKLIEKDVHQFKVYDPFLDQNKYTIIPEQYSSYIADKYTILDENAVANTDAIILCVRHQTILKCNQTARIEKLLSRTNKSCYLFDGWDAWTSALKVKHIIYEGIGIK